ncbi:MAG: fused MFS/spermidine synthase [Nitrospinae bacterium]|nr:fused MFS/spermidine synthase [Nitrospinota bacterium]
MKYARPLILLIFFLSGASGLIYEIVWTRLLSLVFGVSSFAISTVLTVFMAGLGIGGYIFGRLIDKRGNPLKVYAVLEILIGLYAILLPNISSLTEWLYIKLHVLTGGSFLLLSSERFLISFFILIFPTTMMGGTLPVISRFLIKSEDRIGIDTGVIYSLNTFGAVAGCIITGFYLIEVAGVTQSLYLAAVLNLIAGGGAYIISQKPALSKVEGSEARSQKSELKAKDLKIVNLQSSIFNIQSLILLAFGFSGMAALSYEVLWTRVLILILDNTIYAFSIILVTFLLGIAGGSFLFARLSSNQKRDSVVTLFAVFQILIGLMGFLSLLLFANHNIIASQLNNFISWTSHGFASLTTGFIGIGHWQGKMFATFLMAFLIMIIPTVLMGASFPAVTQTLRFELHNVGKSIGMVYLTNTVGAIIGSFSSGFILLPIIGIQNAIILTGIFPIVFGMILILLSPLTKGRGKLFRYVISILSIMISGIIIIFIFRSGDIPKLISISKIDKGNEILYYKEGIAGTVLVSSQETDLTPFRKPVKRLWINGDPIAGEFRGALQLERLQAHLPLLFHPDPKEALIICFGTGSTAGAVSDHNVNNIYAVDISKEVFNGGRYFTEGNRDILNDSRFKMIIEDGRNFLLTTDKKFDLITSEPPPPSNAGIVNLYSREYYMLCKSRLKEGGMVSHWIPLHHLSEDDFKMLVSTFVSVFPHSTMWFTKWDAIMIGSDERLSIDFENLKERLNNKKIQESLKEIGMSNPFQLLSTFMMDEDALHKFIDGAPVVTDNNPYVEFTAPRIHHIGTSIKGRNLLNMLKYRKPVTVNSSDITPLIKGGGRGFIDEIEKYFNSYTYFLKGQVGVNDNSLKDAVYSFKKAVEINNENSDARHELINLSINSIYRILSTGEIDKGFDLINECMGLDRDREFTPQLYNLRGLLFLSKKDIKRAVNEFEYAITLDGKYFSPYLNLGSIYTYYEIDLMKALEYYNRGLELKITAQERDLINYEIEKIKAKFPISN